MCVKSHWCLGLGRASDCSIPQEGLEEEQQPADLYLCCCHGIVAPVTQSKLQHWNSICFHRALMMEGFTCV